MAVDQLGLRNLADLNAGDLGGGLGRKRLDVVEHHVVARRALEEMNIPEEKSRKRDEEQRDDEEKTDPGFLVHQ